jgi:hypothetical protein
MYSVYRLYIHSTYKNCLRPYTHIIMYWPLLFTSLAKSTAQRPTTTCPRLRTWSTRLIIYIIYTFLRIVYTTIRIYLASSYIISINQTCHGLHVVAYNLFSYICLYIKYNRDIAYKKRIRFFLTFQSNWLCSIYVILHDVVMYYTE